MLINATRYGFVELVKILIAEDCDTNIKNHLGNTALVALIDQSSLSNDKVLEIGKILIIEGEIDVNLKSNKGKNALITLSAYDDDLGELADIILKNGGLVNEVDNEGKTALIYASGAGNHKIVKLLLKNFALINKADNNGDTPLIHASRFGEADIVRTLIINGVSIDQTNNLGQSALIIASSGGYYLIVELLLENGAEINLVDSQGKTALMFASDIDESCLEDFCIGYGCDREKVIKILEAKLKVATDEKYNSDHLKDLLKKIIDGDFADDIKKQAIHLLGIIDSGISSVNPEAVKSVIAGSVCGGALYLSCEAAYTSVGFLSAGPPGAAIGFFGGQPKCWVIGLAGSAVGGALVRTENLHFREENSGVEEIKNAGLQVNPPKAESKVWKELKPYKKDVKTNGLSGRDKRYYKWDPLHNDIEVFDCGENHLGSMDPKTGGIYKPAVRGRKLYD